MDWLGSAGDETKPFLDHLEDLRRTIAWSLGLLLLGVAAAVPLAPSVFSLLKQPLVKSGIDPERFLSVLHVTGGFQIAARVVLWSGILFSAPLVLLCVARFVAPGMTLRERRAVARGAGLAVLLFGVGVGIGWLILPMAVSMMLRLNRWIGTPALFWETASYVTFTLRLLLAFGLAFEMPVVLLALGSVGIIASSQLREKRRHVVVGLMVLSMLLTPQDPFTMLAMAAPLCGLYEMCIWLIWLKERRRSGETAQG